VRTDARRSWRGALAAAGVLAASAGGCGTSLDVFSDSSARFIGEETYRRITPGETDVAWVKAVLGDPHKTAPLADSHEVIWRYNYQRVRANIDGAFLVKKNAGSKPENVRHIYVQVANGVVTDVWRD